MIYLLDTDTFVFMLRGLKVTVAKDEKHRHWQTIGRRIISTAERKQEVEDHEVGLSAISVAELEFGARNSGHYEREIAITRRSMSPFTLFDFEAADCAFHYGSVRGALEMHGNSIGPLDTLIAAHALALGATLVTNNMTEFARVPGLQCGNWAI